MQKAASHDSREDERKKKKEEERDRRTRRRLGNQSADAPTETLDQAAGALLFGAPHRLCHEPRDAV